MRDMLNPVIKASIIVSEILHVIIRLPSPPPWARQRSRLLGWEAPA